MLRIIPGGKGEQPGGQNPWPVPRIRVWPRTEDIRKYIKHPNGNIGFRATIYESVEWPLDAFTKRRLADRPPTVLDHPPDPPPEPSPEPPQVEAAQEPPKPE